MGKTKTTVCCVCKKPQGQQVYFSPFGEGEQADSGSKICANCIYTLFVKYKTDLNFQTWFLSEMSFALGRTVQTDIYLPWQEEFDKWRSQHNIADSGEKSPSPTSKGIIPSIFSFELFVPRSLGQHSADDHGAYPQSEAPYLDPSDQKNSRHRNMRRVLFPDRSSSQVRPSAKKLTPSSIKAYLDLYVIGQDRVKRALSIAVHQHLRRVQGVNIQVPLRLRNTEVEKSNVLIVGPTGVGKTLLARTVARLLEVPFAVVDATAFTESGYVGEDVESILSRLLQAADHDVELAEMGIVYIDEIDKLARKSSNPSLTRDVGGEGVQQGLLKILEGTDVYVPPHGGRKHPEQKMVKINTKNILFLCGGSFEGIENLISRRLHSGSIGFRRKNNKISQPQKERNYLPYISPMDLRTFGLIPELLGRLPVIASLDPFDEEMLLKILTLPKNALIPQYEKIFAQEGKELIFDQDAMEEIVSFTLRLGTGARGLRSVCERVLEHKLFDLPDMQEECVVITKDYVRERTKEMFV